MIIFRGKSFSIMFFSNNLIISFQSCSLCSLLAVIYKSHYVQEAFTLHFIHPPTYNSLSEPFNCAMFLHLSKISHCLSRFVFLSVYLSSSFYNCLSLSVSLPLCLSVSLFLSVYVCLSKLGILKILL